MVEIVRVIEIEIKMSLACFGKGGSGCALFSSLVRGWCFPRLASKASPGFVTHISCTHTLAKTLVHKDLTVHTL